MGLKKYRPTTPTLRHTVMPDYSELTRSRPVKALTERLYKTGGRALLAAVECVELGVHGDQPRLRT